MIYFTSMSSFAVRPFSNNYQLINCLWLIYKQFSHPGLYECSTSLQFAVSVNVLPQPRRTNLTSLMSNVPDVIPGVHLSTVVFRK